MLRRHLWLAAGVIPWKKIEVCEQQDQDNSLGSFPEGGMDLIELAMCGAE